ncbi:MAG: protein phosphatase 2C domain-containing protein [Paludibacteraceae bacterium]|nr:protein phosphatase 2C domain-containing protein [Paludibacteraceae bacterium]
MKDVIKFRLAARCEAAGRPNNEDNFQLDENLSDNQWGFTSDKEIELGEKGALLVVCDGMGGMNAGEVASAIAVQAIKEYFSVEKLTEAILANPTKYIASSIVAADAAIKADAKANPEHDGMGSTIVMAWLLGKKVYVGWCGDSRCYCYNPKNGLIRLSHDHSYVQELVDAGKLTEDLAFDHPNSNIITRSLGDPNGIARPDVKEYDLHNEDIILLCSDGLCGCLRDNEIENQISAHQTSMQECRDALWVADEAAGWHDNVTIALAQVLSGGAVAVSAGEQTGGDVSVSNATLTKKNKKLKILIVFLLVLLVGIVGFAARKPVIKFCEGFRTSQDSTAIATSDTAQVDVDGDVSSEPEPQESPEDVKAEGQGESSHNDPGNAQKEAEGKCGKKAEQKEQQRLPEEKAQEAEAAEKQNKFQSQPITVQIAEQVPMVETETDANEPQENPAKVSVTSSEESISKEHIDADVKVVQNTVTPVTVQVTEP